MNLSQMWLAFTVAVWFVAASSAAPVPPHSPKPQGPISDLLRLRGLLPQSAALRPTQGVLVEKGVLEFDHRVPIFVTKEVVENVLLPDGRTQRVSRLATERITESRKARVQVALCKVFTVTAEGKFQAVDAEKATAMLKKKVPILTGQSAEVDLRTLELIKPGTLCVICSAEAFNLPPMAPLERPQE